MSSLYQTVEDVPKVLGASFTPPKSIQKQSMQVPEGFFIFNWTINYRLYMPKVFSNNFSVCRHSQDPSSPMCSLNVSDSCVSLIHKMLSKYYEVSIGVIDVMCSKSEDYHKIPDNLYEVPNGKKSVIIAGPIHEVCKRLLDYSNYSIYMNHKVSSNNVSDVHGGCAPDKRVVKICPLAKETKFSINDTTVVTLKIINDFDVIINNNPEWIFSRSMEGNGMKICTLKNESLVGFIASHLLSTKYKMLLNNKQIKNKYTRIYTYCALGYIIAQMLYNDRDRNGNITSMYNLIDTGMDDCISDILQPIQTIMFDSGQKLETNKCTSDTYQHTQRSIPDYRHDLEINVLFTLSLLKGTFDFSVCQQYIFLLPAKDSPYFKAVVHNDIGNLDY
jgi:hypothetical protein